MFSRVRTSTEVFTILLRGERVMIGKLLWIFVLEMFESNGYLERKTTVRASFWM